ncbi:MAG: protein kinase, partial [Acidobacteriia bacterium]|nr:protein kinase [Terriglobia bacterium]
MIGQTIAHYKITAELGKGGMGEVYRATDLKLGRDVALKILPESFAKDPERMARFQREAHVLAALNHPNIAAIYGVEERALVMELVEGPTLADRAKPGPIPLEQTLRVAKQIAEALEYAHDKNVVHRDLKPANVKVTPEGAVKVLDFGLAKIADDPQPPPGDPENSPTLTMAATKMGVIIGTAAYMAPEQASGLAVDKRADIWSFGVVLWEMLAGGRMFSGQTVSHTLAAVLTKDLNWDEIPGSTPAPIRHLLRRCLEREVKNRLRDIGEARVTLEEQLAHPAKQPEAKPVSSAARPRWALAAVVCAVAASIAAASISFVHFREKPLEGSAVRFSLFLPTGTVAEPWSPPVISPDGKMLVISATAAGGKRGLWLRSMDTESFQMLEGTDNGFFPFWSPDSRHIGFFADRKLKKVDARGGAPLTLCELSSAVSGGAWNRDGVIVFGSPNLQRVPAGGGEPKPLLKLDKPRQEIRQLWPSFLPDGNHFVYLSQSTTPEKTGIYLGSLDSEQSRLLMPGDSNAIYAAPGFLLFGRQQTLLARAFD